MFNFRNEVATFAVIGTLIKGEKYFMRIDFYKDDGGGTSFFIKRMKDPSSYVFFMSAETRTLSTGYALLYDHRLYSHERQQSRFFKKRKEP